MRYYRNDIGNIYGFERRVVKFIYLKSVKYCINDVDKLSFYNYIGLDMMYKKFNKGDEISEKEVFNEIL